MHAAAVSVLEDLLAEQLADLPSAARAALQAELEWRELRAGDTLMRQGDPAEDMAWLVSGRLQIRVGERLVRELGRGAVIGEIALFTAERRSASVLAVRDSLLVHLHREAFERLTHAHPALSVLLARQLVQRLRSEHRAPAWAPPRTIALLGEGAAAFAPALAQALARHGSVHCLAAGADPAALPASEAAHAFTLLVADGDAAWTDWCLRHADEQLLLADGDAAPTLPLPAAGLAAQTLLLLHQPDCRCPQGSAAWQDAAPAAQLLHLRRGQAEDLERLARHLARRGVGLVLAGGGARGFAHLGVLRALQEAGLPVDAVGGTSMGAAMAVLVASRQPVDALMAVVRQAFRGNPTGDINVLPLVSLIRGRRLRSALRQAVQRLCGHAAALEDLWLPTYVVATNYARASEAVLRRGDLQRAVAASTAIPGALPPVVLDGELHCDGGSFNNLPLDVMRAQRGIGIVIGVDLLAQPLRRVDYDEVPGPWTLLLDRLLRRRRYRLPSLVAYLLNATILYSHARKARDAELADLLLQPELARVGLLQWKRREQIVQQGYDHARQRLAEPGLRERLIGGVFMTGGMELGLVQAVGLAGAALMLASYTMKAMLPLRIAALAACAFLAAYGALAHALPTLLLYATLIPVNLKKTLEIRHLVKAIEGAKADTPVSEWLLPHMHRRTVKAGEWLWHQGDPAAEMLYLQKGQLRLTERDVLLGPGSLVGEIGVFSPDGKRTLSLRCETDCELYSLSAEAMQQLYFQSPQLGFHVMRLIVARLMHDADEARRHVAEN